MSQGRDDQGKFTPHVKDSDILHALRGHSDPVATARELAEVFEVSAETLRRRLSDLHEQGDIERKEVGARAVVWWVDDTSPTESATGGEREDDPLFDLPTAASGRSDVSETVDEHVVAAFSGEE